MTRNESPPKPDVEAPPLEPEPEQERDDKKERVLHTRVPAVLEAELKAVARALRVPVSNLVRTILEDAVAMADRATSQVEQGLERAARSVESERVKLRERISPRPDPLKGVVAFQPVIVAAPSRCARCAAPLEPGDEAALAIREQPGPAAFLCGTCVPKKK